jgi:hypothetical protein
MGTPVLWHNVAAKAASEATSHAALRQSYGRGLYGRKVAARPSTGESAPGERPVEGLVGRRPRTMLRWQAPLSYLIIWQSRGWMVTWHAPWCRRCDCAGAGWRFARQGGYVAGLGFELSSPRYADPGSDA